MSRVAKTLKRVLGGASDANINFDDLRALLKHSGFTERVRGSHHIFTQDDVPEILNLQPRGHQAKPYQVKQVRGVLIAYNLTGPSGAESDEASDVDDAEVANGDG
jgi:hypothetical protein